jgi:Ca2+:H+ antiporter
VRRDVEARAEPAAREVPIHAAPAKRNHPARHLVHVLVLGLPLGYLAERAGRADVAFLLSALALIPIAYLVGLSTEAIAERLGSGLGSVVLAAMSNSVELLIGFLALSKGLTRIVQAAITGSILANILLVLGSAMLAGGLRHKTQSFGGKAANVQATVLFLGVVALFLPTFASILANRAVEPEAMSLWLSGGLLLTYVLGLVFSLGTHRHLFDVSPKDVAPAVPKREWSARKALLVLVGVTLLAALDAEVLTNSVTAAADRLGWTPLFVGAVVLAIVSNASEHWSSVSLAWKDHMHASLQLATASSIQIALFVAPLLVFASQWFATPLTLAFPLVEVVAIGASVLVLNFVTYDGESNWFEGALLLMVYGVLCVAFYLLP